MNEFEYPKHIDQMLDVILCLPKSAWGLVLASIESKIGRAELEKIILQVYEIEKRSVLSKSKPEKKRKRQRTINTPKIIASVGTSKQSRRNQLPMSRGPGLLLQLAMKRQLRVRHLA